MKRSLSYDFLNGMNFIEFIKSKEDPNVKTPLIEKERIIPNYIRKRKIFRPTFPNPSSSRIYKNKTRKH